MKVSPEILREFLRYEPDTGKLFWRARRREWFSSERGCNIFIAKSAGREAFTAERKGYRIGAVFRINLSAHRVIWAIVHGEWPAQDIDHINGNRSDNRIENLRAVSRTENLCNRAIGSHNTSGVIGVRWHARAQKWAAEIKVGGKARHLGLFVNLDDAAAARKRAEQAHGFHPNHGRVINRKGALVPVRTRKVAA